MLTAMAQWISENPDRFWTAVLVHMKLVAVPLALAILVAVPLGILITRVRIMETPVLGTGNLFQTIPSLALIALLIPLGFGIGELPAMTAIFVYALLPILRNTYTGIQGVDNSLRKAARGMGLTNWQLLTMLELPLAFPVIMAGIRTTLVISIGVATLGGLIGAGGLGDLIITGMGVVRDELILAGAIPAALMALVADYLMGILEDWIIPPGMKL